MFFKLKSNDNIIEYLNIKELPLLISDKIWIDTFDENLKNDSIKSSENKLKEFLKEQENITAQASKLNAEKKEMLAEILKLSGEYHNNNSISAKKTIDLYQLKINKINENLEKIAKKIEEISKKIEIENENIFQDSVKLTYNKMSKRLKEINKIDFTIDSLRSQLKAEEEKKKILEEEYKINQIFLRDYIGTDGISLLNDKYNGSI